VSGVKDIHFLEFNTPTFFVGQVEGAHFFANASTLLYENVGVWKAAWVSGKLPVQNRQGFSDREADEKSRLNRYEGHALRRRRARPLGPV
jgi:hypothetical protein